MNIILGSGSPRRKKLLSEWGYRFETLAPQIDEKSIRDSDFRTLPLKVATAKAEALQSQVKDPALLITCDTVVVYQKQLYEKPVDEDDARRMLKSYGNGPVEVITGVAVTNTATGQKVSGTETAKVYFRQVPAPRIEEMIHHGQIFDFAGAFHPDDPAIKPYIVHIEGEMEAVLGLPKALTEKLIKQAS